MNILDPAILIVGALLAHLLGILAGTRIERFATSYVQREREQRLQQRDLVLQQREACLRERHQAVRRAAVQLLRETEQ